MKNLIVTVFTVALYLTAFADADALRRQGMTLRDNRDYHGAFTQFKAALIEARQIQDVAEMGRIYREIGTTYSYCAGGDLFGETATLGVKFEKAAAMCGDAEKARFYLGLAKKNYEKYKNGSSQARRKWADDAIIAMYVWFAFAPALCDIESETFMFVIGKQVSGTIPDFEARAHKCALEQSEAVKPAIQKFLRSY